MPTVPRVLQQEPADLFYFEGYFRSHVTESIPLSQRITKVIVLKQLNLLAYVRVYVYSSHYLQALGYVQS